MRLQKNSKYLSILEEDSKLNVWHFALLSAILCLGYRQGHAKIIEVSRSKIMSLSHISTLPTYHPGYRSEVEITIKPYKSQ